MNKVILMGRLTKDPDIRYSQGENSRPIARYTLAVDRRRANADGNRETDFISCVAFDKQAEFSERYLHKGTKITISGRIQTGSYTNRDGQKVYTTDVIIEEQEFAESRQNAQQGGYQPQPNNYKPAPQQPAYRPQQAPQQAQQYQPEYQQQSLNDGFMAIPDNVDYEGLPFN